MASIKQYCRLAVALAFSVTLGGCVGEDLSPGEGERFCLNGTPPPCDGDAGTGANGQGGNNPDGGAGTGGDNTGGTGANAGSGGTGANGTGGNAGSGGSGGTGGNDCPEGTAECNNDGQCVDIWQSSAHCGPDCLPCPSGWLCSGGKCHDNCPDPTEECNGECADTSSDPDHCGGCGMACGPTEVCSQGSCVSNCGPQEITCGDYCVNTGTHVNHCGGCFQACNQGEKCSNGQCILDCPQGESICPSGGQDECVDTNTDPFNCGGCQMPCSPGAQCVNGNCEGCSILAMEVCDGLDNDCDLLVDEGLGVGTSCEVGTGACKAVGFTICDGMGGTMCSATPGTPQAEICNGVDDDCDGQVDDGVSNCTCNPTPEVCDGIDNDCNNLVDEGFNVNQLCSVGVGACQANGFTVCDGMGGATCSATPGAPQAEVCNGVDDDCNGQIDDGLVNCTCSPTVEVCNGIDDNCDGQVDEGFSPGSVCQVGVGACAAQGVLLCSGGVSVCSATPGTPGVEVCNGIDDDCNGQVDEGLMCQCSPTTELCNGFDDDCDGTADEGFPVGQVCSDGVGACQAYGFWLCDGVGGISCSAIVGTPATEVCNGVDDDCNGQIDDGITCTCNASSEVCDGVDNDCDNVADEGYGVGNACSVGVGACGRTGFTMCDGMGGTTCSAAPGTPGVEVCNGIDDDCNGQADEGLNCACNSQPELCDGVDNDCDTLVDEGYNVASSCAVGVGACERIGVLACQPDGSVACTATAGTPVAEVCNGIDDNCDGSVDEGLMGCTCSPQPEVCDGVDNNCDNVVDNGFNVGAACTVGDGACQRIGILICDGMGGVVCSATPGTPQAEVCNGVDDNCDMQVDENLSCTCNSTTEVCDGVDNDCNATVDEGFPVGQDCTVGVGACERNGIFICNGVGAQCSATSGTPGVEVCNGIDDDCNGLVDDGVGPCTCNAQPEVCNGVDDDCDLQVDEGFNVGTACSVGVGACGRVGVLACQPNGTVACTAVPGVPGVEACNGIDDDCNGLVDDGLMGCSCNPQPEVCDGVDNDCNNVVDNGFSLGGACTVGIGACGRTGTTVCDGMGGTECSATPGLPGVEVCNGIDDNCDGQADEGLSCQCSPQLEVCNGIDDNCNATVDEGFPVGQGCTVGIGACERNGVYLCNGVTADCSATAGAPVGEVCNGIDDDCNGLVDDGIGVCTCSPSTEVCDGIDNNCNGLADEGFNAGLSCTVGVGSCERSGYIQCQPNGTAACSAVSGAPSVEICNGIDDDCDGLIDEGLACGCFPMTEVCNGADDDCDNLVDEGGVCGTGSYTVFGDGGISIAMLDLNDTIIAQSSGDGTCLPVENVSGTPGTGGHILIREADPIVQLSYTNLPPTIIRYSCALQADVCPATPTNATVINEYQTNFPGLYATAPYTIAANVVTVSMIGLCGGLPYVLVADIP